MDVLAALQNSIEIAGKLRALSKKIEDADFKMLVADLSNELADAKLEVASLKEALAETRTSALTGLKAENEDLRQRLDRKSEELAALEKQVIVLTERLMPTSTSGLDELPERMLLALTKHDALSEDELASLTNTGKHVASYHLEELRKRKFVDADHFPGSEWSGDPLRTEWSIGHNGREYLVRRGLLS